jgi:hypothetical protein
MSGQNTKIKYYFAAIHGRNPRPIYIILHFVQTGSWAQRASYPMGNGFFFSGVKAAAE